MSLEVREFPPPADLAGIVDAFWASRVGPARPGPPVRVLPDGCVDLILRSTRNPDGGALVEAELFVAGAAVRAQTVPVGSGEGFVGVRFRPGMSRVLIDADPTALAGRDTAAAELGPALARLGRRLGEVAADPAAVLAGLRDEVRRAAAAPDARRARPPRRVQEALLLLGGGGGHGGGGGGPARVDAVARAVGITPRSLHRDVAAWTGMAPKVLARVLRFRAAVARLRDGAPQPLAEVAQEAGYADQAHMAREFREFAGVAPSRLVGGAGTAGRSPIRPRRGGGPPAD